jgi:hypothetical protein
MQNSKNSCKYFRDEYNQDLKLKNLQYKKQGRSSSGYYLCIQTMTVMGPDHQSVNPESCNGARGCYMKI